MSLKTYIKASSKEVILYPKWSRLSIFFTGKITYAYASLFVFGLFLKLEDFVRFNKSQMFNASVVDVAYVSSTLMLLGAYIYFLFCPRDVSVVGSRSIYVEKSMYNINIWNLGEKIEYWSSLFCRSDSENNKEIGVDDEAKIKLLDMVGKIKRRLAVSVKDGDFSLPKDVTQVLPLLLQSEYEIINTSNIRARIAIAFIRNIAIFIMIVVTIEGIFYNLFDIFSYE